MAPPTAPTGMVYPHMLPQHFAPYGTPHMMVCALIRNHFWTFFSLSLSLCLSLCLCLFLPSWVSFTVSSLVLTVQQFLLQLPSLRVYQGNIPPLHLEAIQSMTSHRLLVGQTLSSSRVSGSHMIVTWGLCDLLQVLFRIFMVPLLICIYMLHWQDTLHRWVWLDSVLNVLMMFNYM